MQDRFPAFILSQGEILRQISHLQISGDGTCLETQGMETVEVQEGQKNSQECLWITACNSLRWHFKASLFILKRQESMKKNQIKVVIFPKSSILRARACPGGTKIVRVGGRREFPALQM